LSSAPSFSSRFHSPTSPPQNDDRLLAGGGLLKPSAIKPLFLTLSESLVLRRLGVLQPEDQAALRQAIVSLLA
jgi:hypothetical protein